MVDVAKGTERLRLVAELLRSISAAPHLLVYPLASGFLLFTLPFAFLGLVAVLLNSGWSYVGLLLSVVVLSAIHPALMVAYCHELNEVFEGRRPSFGEGLRVALQRKRVVVLTGFVVVFGHYLAENFDDLPFVDGLFGGETELGIRVARVFAFPVVATTRASPRETLEEIQTAIEREWGRAVAVTVAAKALVKGLVWTSIGAGVLLGAATLSGLVDLSFWPLGPVTPPIIVAASGIVGAVALQLTVTGLVQTALYRYATDGRLPPTLSVDANQLVTAGE